MKKILVCLVLLLPMIAFAEDRPGVEITPRDSGPSLVDLAVTSSIADRNPDGAGDSFPASVGKLYCWTAVKNTGEPTQLTHVWRFGDRVISEVPMNVGKSSRWRTYSRQRINEKLTGQWSCEVVDENKESLGKASFSVQ